MWSLRYPAALLLLPLMALLVWWVHLRPGRGGRLSFSFSFWRGDGFRVRPGTRAVLRAGFRLLSWLGLLLLLVALAGPDRIERRRIYLTRGIDLVIALDVSPSMSARDMEPENRFEAARSVIQSFVAGRENDSIGLVSFGLEAALRVPPTLDHDLLLEILDSLRILELGDGTAIGLGIGLSALHLEKAGGPERVIVLLTDGENNAGEITPARAAEIARRLRCRIYTIGLGREGEAFMQFTDPASGREYRGVYQGRLDEELLRRVARISGGKYYRAGSPGTLEAIFGEIDALEKTERRARTVVHREPLHGGLILAGLLLILADFAVRRGLLGERV